MKLRMLDEFIDLVFIIDIFDEKSRKDDNPSGKLVNLYHTFTECVVFVDYYNEKKNFYEMLESIKPNCNQKNIILHINGHAARTINEVIGFSVYDKYIVPFSKIENILIEINSISNSFILNLMVMCESKELLKNKSLPFHVYASNLEQSIGVVDKLKVYFETLETKRNLNFKLVFDTINSHGNFSYQ
jgi:hypothetical protein